MSWTLYYIIIMLLEQTMICTEFVIVQNQLSWAAVNQNSITRLSRKKNVLTLSSIRKLWTCKCIRQLNPTPVRWCESTFYFVRLVGLASHQQQCLFTFWWWQNIKKMSLNMPRPRIREGGVVLRLPALLIFRLLLHKRTRVVVLWLL